MTHQESIELTTSSHGEMHDITPEVRRIAQNSGVRVGLAHVFNVGSTACVGTVEYEPGLERDLPEFLDKAIPPSRNYGPRTNLARRQWTLHLQATLMGPSLTIPVANGALVLGTWQQVFHLECDVKRRNRTIVVTVTGD